MNLTLYYAPHACPLVPLVTLYEIGAPFTVKPISLKKGQQRTPEYLRINPKGKVPTLDADGELITENTAILSFLAKAFPAARLLPEEEKHAIKALSVMNWCASGLHPSLTRINNPARFCDLPAAAESIRRLATEDLLKNFKIVDTMLAGRDWLFGHWTAVDAYLFWVWRRFGELSTVAPPVPNYAAHGERMRSRPSVQKAFTFEQETKAADA